MLTVGLVGKRAGSFVTGIASLPAGHGGGDYFLVRDFITAIRDGHPPPIDVYRALDYTVPGLISEQSIAQGGVPLAVPDFRR